MTDRKQNVSNADKPDSEFDRELAMVTLSYRAADAGSDGPPAAMDDAIRAAARRAVKSGPRTAGKSWVARWSAPLSAAALVVLTTSVVFVSLNEQPDLAPPLPQEALVRTETSITVPTSPRTAPESSATGVLQAPAAPPVTVAKEKKTRAEDRNAAPRDQLAQGIKPMPAQNRSDAGLVAPDAVIAEESKRVVIANSPIPPAPVAATPPAKEVPVFVADPLAMGAIAASKYKSALDTKLEKRETAQDSHSAASLASAGASARADAPAYTQKVQPAAPLAAPVVASRVAAALLPMMADKAIEPAEAWIKRILELKKHGKAGEFEEELAKFRRQYPNFKLPDELKTDK